jgi:hypothetical protein
MPGGMVPMGLEIKIDAIKCADFKTARALMPTTIQKAVIEGVPMSVVVKAAEGIMPAENIIGYIEHELIILSAMVNIDQRLNIQPHQLQVIAQELYNEFKAESMEDISVCFRRGATGKYGEIYRLDGAVISGWMRAYMEEKYQVIEANLMAEKETFHLVKRSTAPKDQPNPQRNLLSLLQTVIEGKDPGVDIAKYLKPEEMEEVKRSQLLPLKANDGNNANLNAFQRFKLERKKEREEHKKFQDKLHKISSEFYEGKGQFGDIKTYEDDKGFYILAASEADAEEIYKRATN